MNNVYIVMSTIYLKILISEFKLYRVEFRVILLSVLSIIGP